jgi:hypothetical protein
MVGIRTSGQMLGTRPLGYFIALQGTVCEPG